MAGSGRRIDSTPKYTQLKEIIKGSLRRGEFRPGDRLPTQCEMANQYGVSLSTVREAVASLVHEGLLVRIQGSGTYLSDRACEPLTIALMLPNLETDRDSESDLGCNIAPPLAHAVEAEAKLGGANIMLYLCGGDLQMERQNLLSLASRKLDAIILFYVGGAENMDYLRSILDSGVPTVLIDRYIEGMDFDYVTTDSAAGAFKAVKYLADSGMRRIYHVTVDVDYTTLHERFAGYRQAVEHCGLPCEALYIDDPEQFAPSHHAGAFKSPDAMLEAMTPPFGLFAANAMMLEWIWSAIERKGIPHDQVSLACFDRPYIRIPDDILFVQVAQPLEEIGRECVRLALAKINGDSTPRHVKLQPIVNVVGGSPASPSAARQAAV